MIHKVNIFVSGRVQGVFFRQSTKNKAKELGIVGTVRNIEDGRVEIVAQAEYFALKPFIDWCHKGPIAARVDQVEIIQLKGNDESLISFDIV
jgi:acylphosphatase